MPTAVCGVRSTAAVGLHLDLLQLLTAAVLLSPAGAELLVNQQLTQQVLHLRRIPACRTTAGDVCMQGGKGWQLAVVVLRPDATPFEPVPPLFTRVSSSSAFGIQVDHHIYT